MSRNSSVVLGTLVGLGVSLASQAGPVLNGAGPYERIIESNVFRLRPPPVEAPPPVPPPRAKVQLVGITGLLGHEVALLKVEIAGTAAERAQEFSTILGAGEKDRGIEVLRIDAKARQVQVSDFGTTVALSFEPETPATTPAPRQVALHLPGIAARKTW